MKKLPKIVYEYIEESKAKELMIVNRYHYATKGNSIYRIVMIEKMESPRFRKGYAPLTHKCTAILIEPYYRSYPNNNIFQFTEFYKEKTEQLDSIKTFVCE